MIGKGVLVFNVTDLNVAVQEGITLMWQRKEIDSGRLTVKLGKPGSCAVIDYETGMVNVEFRAQIAFDQMSEILCELGADPGLTAPIDAIIRSRGSVFEDHSLRLAGKAQLADHELFDPAQTRIEICAPSQ